MEYASIVWDPYQITYINNFERIQRRAANGLHQSTADLVAYLTNWNL